jgi:NAD(P)-dependent dehydrogenase (short-subunit alcohol dehydrogenase family)
MLGSLYGQRSRGLDRLFAQIEREKGKLDILFANAGITTITPWTSSPRRITTPSSIST